jgi:hypothetical protein
LVERKLAGCHRQYNGVAPRLFQRR